MDSKLLPLNCILSLSMAGFSHKPSTQTHLDQGDQDHFTTISA